MANYHVIKNKEGNWFAKREGAKGRWVLQYSS